jgi:hypothetical protein
MFACFGSCGNDSGVVQEEVVPKITATVSPSTINAGEAATITWTTKDASRVEITGFPDATSPSGVVVVYPTDNVVYTLIAYSVDGISRSSIQLQITVVNIDVPGPPPPPPTTGVMTLTITWILPTHYSDDSVIEQAALDNLVTQVYMKSTNEAFSDTDIPIATSAYGATSVTLSDVTVTLGQVYYFSARIHVAPNGKWSDFAGIVTKTWTSP